MTTATLNVPDISCDHCKSSIEGAVSKVNGVDKVEVAVAARTVEVHYDGAEKTYTAIVGAIEEQGYEVAG